MQDIATIIGKYVHNYYMHYLNREYLDRRTTDECQYTLGVIICKTYIASQNSKVDVSKAFNYRDAKLKSRNTTSSRNILSMNKVICDQSGVWSDNDSLGGPFVIVQKLPHNY